MYVFFHLLFLFLKFRGKSAGPGTAETFTHKQGYPREHGGRAHRAPARHRDFEVPVEHVVCGAAADQHLERKIGAQPTAAQGRRRTPAAEPGPAAGPRAAARPGRAGELVSGRSAEEIFRTDI